MSQDMTLIAAFEPGTYPRPVELLPVLSRPYATEADQAAAGLGRKPPESTTDDDGREILSATWTLDPGGETCTPTHVGLISEAGADPWTRLPVVSGEVEPGGVLTFAMVWPPVFETT